MVKQQFMEFEDTNIVAYLHYKGHPFVPYKKDKERIGFRVYGDNIEYDLAKMYLDTEIQSFLKCLKSVRNSLFTTKATLQERDMED